MTKIIIDENNKVLYHIETTHDLKIVDDIPTEPEQKIGKINVKYYNPETGKIEWKQEDRPLTQEEKMDINTKSIQDLNIAMSEMIAG